MNQTEINQILTYYHRGGPVILWRGPSAVDPGREAVLVLRHHSRNDKTGPIHQIMILDPAAKSGQHVGAGCRLCPVRAACYVLVWYDILHKCKVHAKIDDLPTIPPRFWDRFVTGFVRWGEYGDPAALTFEVVDKINGMAGAWSGYTHFWNSCDQRFRRTFMASVETVEGLRTARGMGWRCYISVNVEGNKAGRDYERKARSLRAWAGNNGLTSIIVCPHYTNGTQCGSCPESVRCSGVGNGGRVDVMAWAHGALAGRHPGDKVPLLPVLD